MSDIDRLTIVVACGFLMLVGRLPEQDARTWGMAHLTFDLVGNLALAAGVLLPVLYILGVWKP